ncbi:MAG: ParB/RepB/Spo0J family partition protein [Candidatus Binatia bacterium]
MPKRPDIKALDLSATQGHGADHRHPVDTFTEDADAGRVVNIPVEAITPNPDQPRKYFDPQALRDLTESVRERGILQPIIVRRSPDGAFILIAGERRWRASKAAGLAKIPVLIRQREDPAEIALIENLQREDLNPIEEAESLKRLKDRRQLTDQALARIIGKGRVSVTESLSLTNLPEAIKAECRRADIYSKRQLLGLLRAPNESAQLALWHAMKSGQLTGDGARLINRQQRNASRPTPYRFTYKPEKPTFTVLVIFRKSRASHDDVKDALREAIKHVT